MSDCDCHFEVRNGEQRKVLLTVFAINGVMFVAEFVVGLFAQSSGVIADSLDMLADALVWATGSRWPDLIVGSIIAAVVAKGGAQILRETGPGGPA